jgi:hypothetical protein
MPTPPRDRPHFFIRGGGEKAPYTARGGGGRERRAPERNRASHAALLSAEFERAVAAAREARSMRSGEELPATTGVSPTPGFYLEFGLSGELTPEALGSLEDRRKGIEVVAVRPGDDPRSAETIATVFVPDRSAEHFAMRIQDFRDKDTKSGKPKNLALVASIDLVRAATPRSVFTDRANSFPENIQQELWWELWIRSGYEAQIDSASQRFGIVVKPHVVRFPERDVKLVRASVTKLAILMQETDGVAELRIASDTPAFFLRESNADAADWIEDLLSRVAPLNEGAEIQVVICILDSGITHEHPLLRPRIDRADVLTVDPTWGTVDGGTASDGGGHGTGMAGLALYGDLTECFIGNTSVEIPYRLESVKILPPVGANEPNSYGAITLEAVARAEASAPARNRIVCMAITADSSGQGGRPSSWSAAVDQISTSAFEVARLIVVAAGNIRDATANWTDEYLERNDTAEIESPGQAWNALTIGAITEKLNILDNDLAGWNAVSPPGDLCPCSRTSLMFGAQWPIKPDVVLEGGNYAHDGGSLISAVDDLQLLTAGRPLNVRLVTTFGDTSAATALGANLAARIAAARPTMWPESVRALVVHSAEWSPAMLARSEAEIGVARKRVLLRRYGYGIPDLARALRSSTNDVTLIVEDSLRPFELRGTEIKSKEMNIHALPWPREVLESMGETEVEMRVTLSYFIEPNPGERGWTRRHRYASHGLRFEVKHQLESDDAFRRRLSRAVEDGDDDGVSVSASDGWHLGPRARNSGSIHSDRWTGTGSELARRGAIGVYPIGGWWKEQRRLNRYDSVARYSLIASIRTRDQEIDIYTPVSVALGIEIAASVRIGVES